MSRNEILPQRGWKPKHNPWLIAVVVTLAAFMEILDTTVVNVAMPHIAGTLGSSYDDATWALTSYLVANGIVLTISGWLSRVFGRKRYFLICIVMFTVASLLCGLANSLYALVIFRILQGFFGGGLQPCQQSIILDTFPPEKRGAAFSLTAVATVVAPVTGPLIGGYLTDELSWRWIFFVNVPFGILTILAVMMLVEDPAWEKARREKVDVVGIGLISLGLGCLEIMADRGEDEDWFSSSFIVTMSLVGGFCIFGAIIWLCRIKNPLVKLSVLKDRNFAVGTILISVMGGILYASAVIIPQFSQQMLGYTATISGFVLAPGGVAVVCLIPFVNWLMKKVHVRFIIACGFFLLAMAMFQATSLYAEIDLEHLIFYRVCQTATMAFLFVPITTVAYSTLPRELNADASALFSMTRNYIGSLAISIGTATIIEIRQRHQVYVADNMTIGRSEYSAYLDRVKDIAENYGYSSDMAETYGRHRLFSEFTRQVALLAYNDVFFLIGLLSLATIPLCFFLPAKRADTPIGVRSK
ncbi:DHA2 family efflux MFS transporter permease subunit [Acetobacter sp.]|jgi:DHA2 family multidrug resistance protein|uniref:DHA2 family efflux MFS transporter permease subunit n=1 Tax=Acetobacter sp. TaxID=440 RepID=UPI0025B85B4C|nr:DHA2 family efflux MFS transporter permease subunit [Acetobacter sp.]MCH4092497.1 DHA2 family efflux MFS transporter permease subunit [Acetobacter sp.]MCI1299631.1 DHA2 family efflux MFS transporter permease subunit [Acetobacter sp.]MCI1315489.1 DHA2 family efflux MFS transporter permease subunit [Acetobacter sp.]